MKNIILSLLIGGVSLGAVACSGSEHGDHSKSEKVSEALYHCPMHPTYTSDRPGDCSICGMALVPVDQEEEGSAQEGHGIEGQGRIKVNTRRRQLIGLKTALVEARPLVQVIRTVGRIAYDPELYRTQEEFLTALATQRRLAKGSGVEAQERSANLVSASRLRLKILGLSNRQIDALARKGKPELGLLLSQGKGQKVWLYADVYENDLPIVEMGQTVEAVSASLPGKIFHGKVRAIDPNINPQTRSVRVRVRLDDPEGHLRPDLYLNARIKVDLGLRISIPASAIVDSGVRQVLFVDEGDGYLSPRSAKLGVRAQGFVEILEGAEEGESVVTSGNFLIDSESKLRAALSGLAEGGHQH